jgi:hypothetical protein
MSALPLKADIQESPRSSGWISSVWMLLIGPREIPLSPASLFNR